MPRGAFSTNGRSEFSKRRSSSPLTKFEVFLSKTAVRQLERFPRDTARRIRAKLPPPPDGPQRPGPGTETPKPRGPEETPVQHHRARDYPALLIAGSEHLQYTESLYL